MTNRRRFAGKLSPEGYGLSENLLSDVPSGRSLKPSDQNLTVNVHLAVLIPTRQMNSTFPSFRFNERPC